MVDLDELVSAHVASRVGGPPPPLSALRTRARRRRQRQVGGVVAIAVVAVLGVGSLAAGAALPWAQQTDTARYAAPVAPGGLLDEGVDDDGAWTLVAVNVEDEGWCILHTTTSTEGGSCDRAEPAQLQEVGVYPTADDSEPLTVVAGDVAEEAVSVQADLSDGSVRRVGLRSVSSRLFFSFRTPAAVTVEQLTALDQDGRVVDQVGPLPPPPPPVPDSLPPPPPLLEPEVPDPLAGGGGALRCGPGVATQPCGAGLQEGQQYTYILQTHCGVKGIYADGREWVPSPVRRWA